MKGSNDYAFGNLITALRTERGFSQFQLPDSAEIGIRIPGFIFSLYTAVFSQRIPFIASPQYRSPESVDGILFNPKPFRNIVLAHCVPGCFQIAFIRNV